MTKSINRAIKTLADNKCHYFLNTFKYISRYSIFERWEHKIYFYITLFFARFLLFAQISLWNGYTTAVLRYRLMTQPKDHFETIIECWPLTTMQMPKTFADQDNLFCQFLTVYNAIAYISLDHVDRLIVV